MLYKCKLTDGGHHCLPVFDVWFYRDAGLHQLRRGAPQCWKNSMRSRGLLRGKLCKLKLYIIVSEKDMHINNHYDTETNNNYNIH